MAQKIYNSLAAQKEGPFTSVQEGEMAVPSIWNGERPAQIVTKIPLAVEVSPYLVGDYRIPSTITAMPGSYSGAPGVNQISYQWLINGVPVPGETGSTFDTTAENHLDRLSCLITATSSISTVQAVTDTMTLVLYDPITNTEYSAYVIMGLGQDNRVQTMMIDYMYITGMAQDSTEINANFTAFTISGMGQDNNSITQLTEVYIITEEAP